MKAKPKAVVFSFLGNDLGTIGDIHIDKAYAYVLGGFMEAWPKGWSKTDLPGFSKTTYEALNSSKLKALFHFRGAPFQILNDSTIGMVRHGMWNALPHDWRAPFVVDEIITGWRLEKHLKQVSQAWIKQTKKQGRTGREAIVKIVKTVAAAGSIPVLMIPPVHPKLRKTAEKANLELTRLLKGLAGEYGGIFGDASGLVDASGFADAVHPQASGRRAYSIFIAQALKKIYIGQNGKERR